MKKYFTIALLLAAGLMGSAQSGNPERGSTSEIQSAVKIKVFPNPATNVVNVLGLKNTSKAEITILDIYGNTVMARQWPVNRNALNIPISQLEPGAYIIRIHSEANQVHTKFYKQ